MEELKKGDTAMESNSNFDAVVAGHICLDIIPGFIDEGRRELDQIFMPGKVLNVAGAKISTGGAVSNTGAALSILGACTRLMCKVGDDPFGDIVKKVLREKGIMEGISTSELAPTAFSIVLSPPGIDRIFLHDPGVNDYFECSDVDFDTVKRARLFHYGYPTAMREMYRNDGDQLVEMYRKVKSLNVTTCMDLAVPAPNAECSRVNWRHLLERVLPFVDIVTPSIEEIYLMLRKEEYTRLCESAPGVELIDVMDMKVVQELGEELLALGVKIAIIKCGKKGFYIRTQDSTVLSGMGKAVPPDLHNWGGRELLEEIYRVERVVSATGAGDTSIAGFLASFLAGRTIEQSIQMACAVGACCVQTFDALSGIKSMVETIADIEAGWEKERICLGPSHWKYDGVRKVWAGKRDTIIK